MCAMKTNNPTTSATPALPNRFNELREFKLSDHISMKENLRKFAIYLNQADFVLNLNSAIHDIFIFYIPMLIIDTNAENFMEKFDSTLEKIESYADYINKNPEFMMIYSTLLRIKRAYTDNEDIEFFISGLDFRAVPQSQYTPEMNQITIGGFENFYTS